MEMEDLKLVLKEEGSSINIRPDRLNIAAMILSSLLGNGGSFDVYLGKERRENVCKTMLDWADTLIEVDNARQK